MIDLIKNYKDQILSLMTRVFISGIGFLVSILIVKFYQKDTVGMYFLFLSQSNFIAQVFLFGSAPYLNILTAKGVKNKGIAVFILKVFSISTILSLFISYLCSQYYDYLNYIYLVSVSFVLSLVLVMSELLKGNKQYIFSQLFVGGVPNLIFAVIISIKYYMHSAGEINDILMLWAFSNLITLFFSMFIYRKYYKNKNLDCIKINIYELLPIYFSSLAVYAFSQLDLWIIADRFNINVTAEYALAIKLTVLLTFTTLSIRAICASQIPRLINKKNELQEEITKACAFSCFVSVGVFLILLIFGKYLISSFFGISYTMTYNILIILSFGQIVNATTGPCDYLLTHTGNGHYLFKITLISLSILIILLSLVSILNANNIYHYCVSVALVVSIQNIMIVYTAYKRTGILSLPLICLLRKC